MSAFWDSLGINLFNLTRLFTLALYFLMNLFFVYIVIDKIYYRLNRDKRYYFTFFMVNILIFFTATMLAGAGVKTGFAFGLFAVFSILRYRTDQIRSKEMTFLFISIILAVINSLATNKVSLVEILFVNVVIASSAYFLEIMWLQRHDDSIRITYEKIELIRPQCRAQLLEDLRQRTGVNVKSVVINKIDFLRDTANVTVYYDSNNNGEGAT